MPTFSEALGSAGGPYEFELKDEEGKVVDVVKFSHFVQKVKAQMEKWLYAEAMKSVQEISEHLDAKKRRPGAPDPTLEVMTRLTNEKACGKFSWTSERMMNAITTVPGISQLLSIVSWSKTKHRPLEALEIQKIFFSPQADELGLLFGNLFKESSPVVRQKKSQTQSQEPEAEDQPMTEEEQIQEKMANL